MAYRNMDMKVVKSRKTEGEFVGPVRYVMDLLGLKWNSISF